MMDKRNPDRLTCDVCGRTFSRHNAIASGRRFTRRCCPDCRASIQGTPPEPPYGMSYRETRFTEGQGERADVADALARGRRNV